MTSYWWTAELTPHPPGVLPTTVSLLTQPWHSLIPPILADLRALFSLAASLLLLGLNILHILGAPFKGRARVVSGVLWGVVLVVVGVIVWVTQHDAVRWDGGTAYLIVREEIEHVVTRWSRVGLVAFSLLLFSNTLSLIYLSGALKGLQRESHVTSAALAGVYLFTTIPLTLTKSLPLITCPAELSIYFTVASYLYYLRLLATPLVYYVTVGGLRVFLHRRVREVCGCGMGRRMGAMGNTIMRQVYIANNKVIRKSARHVGEQDTTEM